MSSDQLGGQLRRQAAREMVAQDARWVQDVVLSCQHLPVAPYLALLLGHHFARIAYEGVVVLRSPNPGVGVPQLAELLTDQFSAVTARARHVAKVLDDTKKTQEQVLAEILAAYENNKAFMVGRTPKWLRWLAPEIGVFHVDDTVVGASVPSSYRLAIDPADQRKMAGQSLDRVVHEWGATVAVLGSADLQHPLQRGSLDLDRLTITSKDRTARELLEPKYGATTTLAQKLLLSMIEGDLNTSRLVMPHVEAGHTMPVFRARVVTLHHSLTAVRRVVQSLPEHESQGARRVQQLLVDPAVERLLSRPGTTVRNRCMHYEITDRRVVPDLSLPMAGVVEAVFPGRTWAQHNDDVLNSTARLAEALADWRT